jgi:hypothetical protein
MKHREHADESLVDDVFQAKTITRRWKPREGGYWLMETTRFTGAYAHLGDRTRVADYETMKTVGHFIAWEHAHGFSLGTVYLGDGTGLAFVDEYENYVVTGCPGLQTVSPPKTGADAARFVERRRKPGDPPALDILRELLPSHRATIERLIVEACREKIMESARGG